MFAESAFPCIVVIVNGLVLPSFNMAIKSKIDITNQVLFGGLVFNMFGFSTSFIELGLFPCHKVSCCL